MSAAAIPHDHSHTDDHAHDHHEQSFIWKYVFSTDHKVIGIQYGITAMLFLLFGFYLMMVMRWSIAYPHEPLPEWMSWIFTDNWKARWLLDGKVTGETYNMFGAMHATMTLRAFSPTKLSFST
jgi:cytochrome c oxidase subunit 1